MRPDPFTHDHYLLRRKIFKLVGGAFSVFDDQGNMVLYSKQKAFKLREDIRLFTDDTLSQEVLSIQARQVIDFSAGYDVVDSASGRPVGTLRRKGLSSMFRDAWEIADPAGNLLAKVQEDSQGLALLRRFVDAAAMFFPQKFHAEGPDGRRLFELRQNFNPFVQKLELDLTPDPGRTLDRRLCLAAAVLILAIEGRQS